MFRYVILLVTVSANLFNPATSEPFTLPEPGVCGVNLAERIYGGSKTALNAYPWTVLLLTQPINGGSLVSYSCGGSLISERFVLTAAHCFKELPPEFHITKVRLGEWDLLSDEDCDDNLCSDKPIDVAIESHVTHADYDTVNVHYDIALIKLAENVTFTEFISPVCLPLTAELQKAPEKGRNFTVVGWGATQRGQQSPGVFGNQYKLEVQVPGVGRTACQKKYPDVLSSELCAGGEQNKDSCSGDSGGALVASESDGYWYQYGVVSWGRSCGRKGTPGIYARVSSFLDWIKEHMV